MAPVRPGAGGKVVIFPSHAALVPGVALGNPGAACLPRRGSLEGHNSAAGGYTAVAMRGDASGSVEVGLRTILGGYTAGMVRDTTLVGRVSGRRVNSNANDEQDE